MVSGKIRCAKLRPDKRGKGKGALHMYQKKKKKQIKIIEDEIENDGLLRFCLREAAPVRWGGTEDSSNEYLIFNQQLLGFDLKFKK